MSGNEFVMYLTFGRKTISIKPVYIPHRLIFTGNGANSEQLFFEEIKKHNCES